MKNYPYPLPALVSDLREAALRASSQDIESRNLGTGTWFRVYVYDPRGQIRYVSPAWKSITFQVFEQTIMTFNGRADGWKCKLVFSVVRTGFPTITTFKPLAFVTSAPNSRDGSVKIQLSGSSVRQAVRLANRSALKVQNLRKVTKYPWRPRGRTRPSPEQVIRSFYNWKMQNGTQTLNTLVNRIVYSRTWSGTRTPGFRTLPKKELPVNPHSVYIEEKSPGLWFEEVTYSGPNPWATAEGGPYIDKLGTAQFGPTPGSCLHDTVASNKAIARLMDKTSANVNANLAQDLAQVSLTARTIQDSFDRVLNAAWAVRKKQFGLATQYLWSQGPPKFRKGREPLMQNGMANNWLCYQYGWKPLLNDITGAMESLSEFFDTESPVVRRTSASATTKRETGGQTVYATSPKLLVSGAWKETFRSTTKYTLYWCVDNRLKVFLQQTGFTNPINLMWEILPFSFVADWALPIGPYLESLTAFSGMTLLRGCKTQFTKMETNYYHAYDGDAPGYNDPKYHMRSAGAHSNVQVRLDRTQVSTWPKMSLPKLKNPGSLIHALNGWALVQQVFRRK